MLKTEICGIALQFYTGKAVFSPDSIDKGTLAMLSQIEFKHGDKILDLGCGYGAAGIYAAKVLEKLNYDVVMSDIDADALKLAEKNAALNNAIGVRTVESDGFNNICDTGFTLIMSNPPYHSDFSVPRRFIEKGFNRLARNGKMYMVTKRKDWYKKKFISIFGGVNITEINGYYVFMAMKKSLDYAGSKGSKDNTCIKGSKN